MKFNQFAFHTPDLATQISELKQLRFLPADFTVTATNPTTLWLRLLQQTQVQALTPAGKNAAVAEYLATPTTSVPEFVNRHAVDATAFYTVALQLLGFEHGEDFTIGDPFPAMNRFHLPYHSPLTTTSDVVTAWYNLLNTFTKGGYVYLDHLAAAGYFHQFDNLPQPLFFNGKAQPVFATDNLVREVVYVESDLDTDHDSRADRLKTIIIRPQATNQGIQVPVVFTASPYNQGTNDAAGDRMMHDVNVPLTKKPVQALTYTDIAYQAPTVPTPQKTVPTDTVTAATETFSTEPSVKLNEYFLARGFAAVYSAGIGTKDSDGVRTTGDPAETAAAVAVIEWLNGNRPAYTDRTGSTAITAWWTTGNVAMTGKSYLGTLATAAATTGVDGLKTVISEAAISNWYDYYREGGLVVAPGGFPGEDADVLAEECFSRQKTANDYLHIKKYFHEQLAAITAGQDRTTGSYNAFWDARNYLKDTAHITADVLIVHGLNDQNVKPVHAYNLWHKLAPLSGTRKLILHQGQHIYINNFQSLDFSDMMNLWLSHELYGIDNGAPQLLPDVLVQDNSQPATWHTFSDWGGKPNQTLYLGEKQLRTQRQCQVPVASFTDQLDPVDFDFYTHNLDQWENDLLTLKTTKLTSQRLVFLTKPFQQDQYLQGLPQVSLRVASDQDIGLISCMLVDYGTARRLKADPTPLWGFSIPYGYHWQNNQLHEFTLAKQPSSFKLISRGHINLQNRTNLWQADPVEPGSFYQVDLSLQPTYYHLLAGHQLGLVICATDMPMTIRGNQGITYSIDPSKSHIELQMTPFH